jgi:hypothetical protein
MILVSYSKQARGAEVVRLSLYRGCYYNHILLLKERKSQAKAAFVIQGRT